MWRVPSRTRVEGDRRGRGVRASRRDQGYSDTNEDRTKEGGEAKTSSKDEFFTKANAICQSRYILRERGVQANKT